MIEKVIIEESYRGENIVQKKKNYATKRISKYQFLLSSTKKYRKRATDSDFLWMIVLKVKKNITVLISILSIVL